MDFLPSQHTLLFLVINVYQRKWKTTCILLIVLYFTGVFSILNVQRDALEYRGFSVCFPPITSIIKQCSILAQPYAYYNSNCYHMIIFRVFPYVVRYLSCIQNYVFCKKKKKSTSRRNTTVFMITNLIESKAP